MMSGFLVGHELTRKFSREEVDLLTSLLDTRRYGAGERIMRENEVYHSIFLIVRGAVEVLKVEAKTGEEFKLIEFGENAFFGEMSFVTDDEPASATIRAKVDTEVAILSKQSVEDLPLYHKLILNISSNQMARMRETNNRYVASLSAQIRRLKVSKEFGQLFIITVILFGLQSVVPDSVGIAPIVEIAYSWGRLLLYLAPFVVLLALQKRPLDTYGITTAGWKRSLVESAILVLAVAPLFTLFKYFTVPREPLFPFTYFSGYPPGLVILYFAVYPIHCFLQELMLRGVMQGSLQRFMIDSNPLVPITVTSLIFAMGHLYKSPVVSLLTFVVSFLLGAVYNRHRNLIGVTVIHYFLGSLAQALGYL
jgi:hypothetical protein